ncbi:hypothetical protein NC651_000063 [Populus alba x Populus x berolinensis]|nr:hypothetical protein NC651_000063 [Populus alba x Populus x berolinensis]
MISHLMEEARGLTVARCFLREEKMVVLRGALVTRLVDAVKDMALGRGIWRGRTRNGCSQVPEKNVGVDFLYSIDRRPIHWLSFFSNSSGCHCPWIFNKFNEQRIDCNNGLLIRRELNRKMKWMVSIVMVLDKKISLAFKAIRQLKIKMHECPLNYRLLLA